MQDNRGTCHDAGMDGRRPEPTPFAVALRQAREASGLTLTGLAEQAGVTKGYLSELETGWKRRVRPDRWQPLEPRRRVLDDLVGALGLSGSDAGDLLYAILRLDPPPRTNEDQTASRFRGIPAGIPVDDLGDDALLRIVENVQGILTEREQQRRGSDDVGGSSGSGRAKDGQKAS